MVIQGLRRDESSRTQETGCKLNFSSSGLLAYKLAQGNFDMEALGDANNVCRHTILPKLSIELYDVYCAY